MVVERRVAIVRRFGSPRERVFEAFTEPRYLSRWFSPSEQITTRVVDHELRAGGRYRFGFRLPDGSEIFVLGEFREVTRPSKLVFTWTWEEPDPHAGIETLVTVSLLEVEDGTEVSVTHERFPNEETRARHDDGWAGTLERLGRMLDDRRNS